MAASEGRKLSAMFDQEVLDELRRQFDQADKDRSGELDAKEACDHFARSCSGPGATDAEVQRLAESLRQQVDSDRSGTISFEEYCFRFGRRYQMEANRRKRSGGSGGTAASSAGLSTEGAAAGGSVDDGDQLRRQREALEQEREALRREREELERARTAAASPTGAASGTSASSASAPPGDATRLPSGSRVTICGLRGAAELNGRAATVLRFDDASGRYVVELDGSGGQKSLRPENLTPGTSGSSVSSALQAWSQKMKDGLRHAAASVQVWAAGYEWWQLLLGAGVVLLFAMTYMQVSSRYPGTGGGGRTHYSETSSSPSGYAGGDHGRGAGYGRYEADDGEYSGRRYSGGGGPRHNERYDDDGGGLLGGGGGGGLLGNLGQTGTLLVLVGIGYACWKGIIPVHKMSFFQLYMLWNIVQPFLFGGRGGYGGPGMYRRRRYF